MKGRGDFSRGALAAGFLTRGVSSPRSHPPPDPTRTGEESVSFFSPHLITLPCSRSSGLHHDTRRQPHAASLSERLQTLSLAGGGRNKLANLKAKECTSNIFLFLTSPATKKETKVSA